MGNTMTTIQTMSQTCTPIGKPHAAVPKSGRFAVRMLTKPAPASIENAMTKSESPQNNDNISVLVPRNAIVWVLGLFALSGVGGPLFNNISARNVSAEASALAEHSRTMTSMLDRFDRTLSDMQKHMDDIDSRVTRLERNQNRKEESK